MNSDHEKNRPDAKRWNAIAQVYGPVVYRWLREFGLAESDASAAGVKVLARFQVELSERSTKQLLKRLHEFSHEEMLEIVRERGNAAIENDGALDASTHVQDIPTVGMEVLQRAFEHIQYTDSKESCDAFRHVLVEGMATTNVAKHLNVRIDDVIAGCNATVTELRELLVELPVDISGGNTQ